MTTTDQIASDAAAPAGVVEARHPSPRSLAGEGAAIAPRGER